MVRISPLRSAHNREPRSGLTRHHIQYRAVELAVLNVVSQEVQWFEEQTMVACRMSASALLGGRKTCPSYRIVEARSLAQAREAATRRRNGETR